MYIYIDLLTARQPERVYARITRTRHAACACSACSAVRRFAQRLCAGIGGIRVRMRALVLAAHSRRNQLPGGLPPKLLLFHL